MLMDNSTLGRQNSGFNNFDAAVSKGRFETMSNVENMTHGDAMSFEQMQAIQEEQLRRMQEMQAEMAARQEKMRQMAEAASNSAQMAPQFGEMNNNEVEISNEAPVMQAPVANEQNIDGDEAIESSVDSALEGVDGRDMKRYAAAVMDIADKLKDSPHDMSVAINRARKDLANKGGSLESE